MSLDEILRFAIEHKRLIELRYNGKRRHVEPHDYGLRGKAWLFAYQLRAWPADGRTVGWRRLDVGKIRDARILDETFQGSRGIDYEKHLAWDVVFARVK